MDDKKIDKIDAIVMIEDILQKTSCKWCIRYDPDAGKYFITIGDKLTEEDWKELHDICINGDCEHCLDTDCQNTPDMEE